MDILIYDDREKMRADWTYYRNKSGLSTTGAGIVSGIKQKTVWGFEKGTKPRKPTKQLIEKQIARWRAEFGPPPSEAREAAEEYAAENVLRWEVVGEVLALMEKPSLLNEPLTNTIHILERKLDDLRKVVIPRIRKDLGLK